jgi:hypothetical protein
MSGDREDLAEAKRRLDAVLTPYFDAVKAGRPPDREVWLNRYPYLAGELSTFLDEHERVLRATEAVRALATGETKGRSSGLINESVADGGTADRDTAGSAGLVFGGFELLGEPIHRGMSVILGTCSVRGPVGCGDARAGAATESRDVQFSRLERVPRPAKDLPALP